MRVNTTILTIAAMMLVAAAQAQNTKELTNEPQTQTVSAPAVPQETNLGITVSQPMPADVKPAPAAAVVVVEPAPAVIVAQKPAVAPESSIETVGVDLDLAGKGAMKSGLISLSLKEVELNSVIRLFATLSEANIIVPAMEGTTGAVKVDVNLKDVEWKPALQAILDTHDLELYEKAPGSEVYSVRKKLPPAEAAKNTRTFLFNHADIAQAEAVIKGIVGDRGQVYAYAQGNAVVVKTSQEIMDDVAQIAERIDNPRKQILIESRILELTDTKNRDRGIDWGDPDGMGLLKRAVNVSNLSYTQDDLNDFNDFSQDTRLTLNAGQLKVLMSALDQISDIQTVSSPKVIVANGEKATIKLIRKEPVIISTPTYSEQGDLQSILYEQDEDGTDPVSGRKRYSTYDYGIMLDVTPTIYTEDNIAVHIIPTISRKIDSETLIRDISGDGSDAPKNIEFPVIDEKRVETTFMLANKQTAVIGGLTETTKEEQQKKVPFLSSIPLIRHLFTYTFTGDVKKENVIFVTVSLEDGKSFDLAKSVQKSPLTRKQLIREDNNLVVDDREVELFKKQEEGRIAEDIRIIERKDEVESRDRAVRKPFWGFLRP